jgi:DNA-binding transcriptional MerR regulator
MLDYLQRSGVFIPADRKGKRRGKGRRYDFREMMVLKTISVLLKNGASVAALKKSLVDFQKAKWEADRASLQFEGEAVRYFVASANSVFFAQSQDKLFDLTRDGQMAFNFVIDLDKIHTDLRFELAQGNLPFAAVS